MKRYDLCLLALVSSIGFSFGAGAQDRLKTNYHLEGGAKVVSEGAESSQKVGFSFSPDFTYQLSATVSFKLVPEVTYETGRIQTRFDDEDHNGLSVLDGYAAFSAGTRESVLGLVDVGVLSLRELNQPLLASGHKSFPGLRQEIRFKIQDASLGIRARQYIPTSKSMNTYRGDAEPVPALLYEEVYFQSAPWSLFESTAFRLGHFVWTQMPAKVAFDSSRFGNSTTGESQANTRFLYRFNGWAAGAEARVRFARDLSVFGEIQHLANEQAPGNSRDGEWARVGLGVDVTHHKIEISLVQFYIESDLTPAVYSSSRLGRLNRAGYAVEAKWQLKRHDIYLVGEIVDSSAIVPSSTQGNFNFYYLGLEAHHAAL